MATTPPTTVQSIADLTEVYLETVRSLRMTGQDEIKKARKAYEAQPCDPPGACATHGRCWTHSEWDD